MKPKDAEDWEIDFRDKFYTQLIDDYGDEHLYDHIISWLRTLLAKERKETVHQFAYMVDLDEKENVSMTKSRWDKLLRKLLEGGK